MSHLAKSRYASYYYGGKYAYGYQKHDGESRKKHPFSLKRGKH